MNILEVSGLNVTFPTHRGAIRASQNVNFSVKEGEICVLVGETGSGKSVIGQAVLNILPPTAQVSGSIIFDEKEILSVPESEYSHLRGRGIASIPQNPTESLSPLMRCGKQISEVPALSHETKKEKTEHIRRLLTSLSFSNPDLAAASYPYELSGGMRQRLTTGIAMASVPRLLVADEPTKGLDYVARKKTMEMFLEIKKSGTNSILMITHDLELAEEIGDTVGVLYSGELIEFGTSEGIFKSPMHPYTKGLLAALPRNGMRPMPGVCPGLSQLPDGCYFRNRCQSPCKSDIHPSMNQVSGRLVRCNRC